jgi:hypothetical protein
MADAQPVPSSSPEIDDPFSHLHKMSITAGLGSGDYVAISGLAIATLLLGVASALVLFHIALLLLIPLAGIVCGVLAFVQVQRSNGTLTGRGIAVLGLLLSLGLGGYEGGKDLQDRINTGVERNQVINLVRSIGANVVAGNYQAAYDLYDADFHSNVPFTTFEAVWQQVRHSKMMGTMNGMDWNGQLSFDNDPLTGQRECGGMVFVKFDSSPEPVRTEMFFRETDGTWRVNKMPQFFAPPAAPATGGQLGPKGPTGSGGKPQMLGPPKPTS